MKASLKTKLDSLVERHEELGHLLSTPDVIDDQKRFKDYAKEYAQLEPIILIFKAYTQSLEDAAAAQAMLKDPDPDMREMGEAELKAAQAQVGELTLALRAALLPKDPNDDCDVYLEVRAGTGGDEAAIFAGDLFRMYSRYCEQQGWRVEMVNTHEGEHGGFKEVIAQVSGESVYAHLKFESGAHRVQRVPVTESQGRVHTSACTVAILPVADEVAEIDINPSDLRIDTYRASGAGGQHVNRTDSAVRITHLPSGVVVECQDERSQHKNKARAMSVLSSRLLAQAQEAQQQAQASQRRSLVGSGDRSERIRTYNFPQGRVTDHRINLTLYKLDDVMQGGLEHVIEPLRREHQADLLAQLSDDDA